MSHAAPGPLAAYNSLQDKHLSGYFSNTRMKRHLKKSGLVAKSGKIIDEKTYRLNMAKKEHRKHVRDLLATAIVHKTLDMERTRQYEIRKRLDEVYKVELVRRVKDGRNRKGDEDILPLLSPRERTAHQRRKAKQEQERPSTAPSAYGNRDAEEETQLRPTELVYDEETGKFLYRGDADTSQSPNGYLRDETEELGPSPYTRAYSSTYPAPAPPPSGTPRHTRSATSPRRGVRLQRFHYLAKTEPAVAHRIQLQSMAEVTMKFLGPSLVLTNSMFPEDRLSEVMVLQQHCGGSTLCVFRELLPPNTIFTFISRRHRGAPFGLTFYIDGMQDIRLSSCCEYKHKPGHVLGGKNGHFQFVVVEGAAPCYRCQVASSCRRSKKKHKTSQGSKGQDEDDERSKAFMTESANDEEEEVGETFNVIITKIHPSDGEEESEAKDASGMVDTSTQTPRDEDSNKEKEEEEEKTEIDEDVTPDDPVEGHKEGESGSGAEGAEKYEDDEFEDEEKEKENESGNEVKEGSDKEDQETKEKDEYNEDFESEGEKEKEESDVEEESDEEEEEEEEDIQDETEGTQKKSTETQKDDEEAEEVEDETEEKKQDSSDRPSSATDSEGKLSKTVSFDEDVTVIKEEQDDAERKEEEETPEDVPEEGAEHSQETGDHGNSRGETEEVPKDVRLEEPKAGEQDVAKEEEVSEPPEEPTKQTEEEEEDREETVKSPEVSDTSSSSSSSSSSESSDSEDEEKKEQKSKKKTKHKPKPGRDPGSDPDLVSSGKLPDQALKAVGVQPGTKYEGSVHSLLEGKEDVDLAGVALTSEQMEEVSRIIESREYLGSVILRNTKVDDNSVERLATALKNAPTVKMLNLSVNLIGPDGARHIADVIRENTALRMLLLHGNPLTNEGVRIIIDAILETPETSIMNLDLGDCGISDDGAGHIAGLIEKNQTVSQLTISGNSIGLKGWQRIGEGLKANNTLATLSLDFNKIGDEEAIAVAEGLRECKSLRSVDLEGNKIGDDGGRKLLEAVKVNKSIIDLTLMPINYISKEILDEVKEVLEERGKNGDEDDAGGEQHGTPESLQQVDTETGQHDQSEGPGGDTVRDDPPTEQDNQEKEEDMAIDVKESTDDKNQEGSAVVEQQEVEKENQDVPSGDVPDERSDSNREEVKDRESEEGGHPSDSVPAEDEQESHEDQQDPPGSVAEPIETEKDPSETVPQPSETKEDTPIGGVPQSSETEQDPSESVPLPSETKEDPPTESVPQSSETEQDPLTESVPESSETKEDPPTESVPQPSETEHEPSETVPEPSETELDHTKSEPNPTETEQVAQPTEMELYYSERVPQPSETEQEESSRQDPSEEGMEDPVSQDKDPLKDQDTTAEKPAEGDPEATDGQEGSPKETPDDQGANEGSESGVSSPTEEIKQNPSDA